MGGGEDDEAVSGNELHVSRNSDMVIGYRIIWIWVGTGQEKVTFTMTLSSVEHVARLEDRATGQMNMGWMEKRGRMMPRNNY